MKKNKLTYYKGRKFIISFDPKEKIIYLQDWGGVDEKKAIEIKKKILEFSEKIPPNETIKLLIEAEKYEKVTPEARRVLFTLAKIIRKKKTQTALITSSPTIRVIAKFIGFGIKNFNSFTTKEKGMKWLRGKKK